MALWGSGLEGALKGLELLGCRAMGADGLGLRIPKPGLAHRRPPWRPLSVSLKI